MRIDRAIVRLTSTTRLLGDDPSAHLHAKSAVSTRQFGQVLHGAREITQRGGGDSTHLGSLDRVGNAGGPAGKGEGERGRQRGAGGQVLRAGSFLDEWRSERARPCRECRDGS